MASKLDTVQVSQNPYFDPFNSWDVCLELKIIESMALLAIICIFSTTVNRLCFPNKSGKKIIIFSIDFPSESIFHFDSFFLPSNFCTLFECFSSTLLCKNILGKRNGKRFIEVLYVFRSVYHMAMVKSKWSPDYRTR